MKVKLKKTDGLGAYEIKRIRSALRQVWQRSHSRKLVIDRCTGEDGFQVCESCHEKTPKLKVDHIIPCGEVDEGYIKRLFVPSKELQGWCNTCHNLKTKEERAKLKSLRKKDQASPLKKTRRPRAKDQTL